ncbi:methyltransferase [Shewanella surugensis]|uniref:Methyltransferase n=1 Tax=Shewanella surugensis TaxID=212020 RepID=A0ABT0L5I9_9GAMM|nr:methyltransferase [Shewanella surugensis]MCL1122944.1 hypothetical protein [Shewanella surugensis]
MSIDKFLNRGTPKEQLLDFTLVSIVAQLIGVVAKLGIADLLKHKPMSAEELAVSIDAHGPFLFRVMRTLVAFDVFRQGLDGKFELSPMSELLQSDNKNGLHHIAILNASYLGWKPQGALFDAIKTGETPFETIFESNLYDFLDNHIEDAQLFGAAMTNLTNVDLTGIIEHLDCSGIETIVDIGAGEGELLSELLIKYPELKGIVADKENTVMIAQKKLKYKELGARCEFIPIDFFESVPRGDAYIMRKVIHNWNDEKASVILKNCRAKMTPQSKLFIVEAVLANDNSGARAKIRDIEMMIYLSANQRTKKEFQTLLESSGFTLARVIETNAPSSIIVATPA